jgi:hypothetical protein
MPTEEENIRVNVAMLANVLAVTEQVRVNSSRLHGAGTVATIHRWCMRDVFSIGRRAQA